MPKRVVSLGAVCLAGVVGLAARSQAPTPTSGQFRTGIDLVRLDVSVLDDQRMPVRGLTQADFTVYEDGRPHAIQAFSEVEVPDPVLPSAPWMRDIEPDFRRNDDLNDRRLVVIVLDDAQVPGGNPRIAQHVRDIGRRIVDRLGPADLAAVVMTVNSKANQEFTVDRERLLAAVDRFVPNGGGMPELFDRYSVETLGKIAEYLADVPQRRKTLFYVSVGVPVPIDDAAAVVWSGTATSPAGDPAGRARLLMSKMEDTFRFAQIANLNIHAIDPSGFDRGPGAMDRFRTGRDFLQTVTEATGGLAFINRDDYEQGVAQVFRETSAYYLLGYQSSRPNDGRFHRIEVTVNRPGLIVRVRSGYQAARPERPRASGDESKVASPLVKALSGLLPVGDLPLQITAAPFFVPGKKEAAVAVALGIVQEVTTGPSRAVENIEFLIDAFGQDGSLKRAHGLKAAVTLRPNVNGKVGYEVLSRVDLKPGRYQLRLSAHLPARGVSGSVFYDVDVPDFTKPLVSLSGAVLNVTPFVVAAPRDRLADLVPIVPTSNRFFSTGERVTSLVKVYQGGKKPMQSVGMSARITDGDGRAIVNHATMLPPAAFTAARVADFRFALPIEALAPGAYLLTFEATTGGTTARRDVRFVRTNR